MDYIKRQKKILAALAIFLAVMFLLTLISRAVYVKGLAQVAVAKPERKSVVHSILAEGTIAAGGEFAFNVLLGMRVEAVFVNHGDSVDAGDALLGIDIDDLSKLISDKKLVIEELELAIEDMEKNANLSAEERSTQRARAQENYDRAVFEGQVRTARAQDDLDAAKRKLKDFDGDEDSYEYEALKEAVKSYERALQDAEWAAGTAALEASRSIYDAARPENSDSSLEVKRMELLKLEDEVEKYQKILDDEGVIFAEKKGVVSRINAFPGERTADGAAVLFADLDKSVMFKTFITKEEKKYINRGDVVKIDFGRYSVKEYKVDYLAESDTKPGMFEVSVVLGKDGSSLGQSGTLLTDVKSEPYNCCIPIDALHEDANHRKFIYIVGKRSGILGDELVAQVVYVKVLDQNDGIAAIEEGGLAADTQVIVSSSKEIKDGDVVRYKE